MSNRKLLLAAGAGALAAAALISLANLRSASAQGHAPPIRWEHRCGFSSDPSLQALQRLVNAAGDDGWELAAAWPDLERKTELDRLDVGGTYYCVKRPSYETAAAPPATAPPAPLPTERDLVAALGSSRTLLGACRDTYARGVTQLAVSVTVAPSGRVQEATLEAPAGNGSLGDCVERVLKLVALKPYRGAPGVLRTTLTLPAATK